jgi:hypothetical protein
MIQELISQLLDRQFYRQQPDANGDSDGYCQWKYREL